MPKPQIRLVEILAGICVLAFPLAYWSKQLGHLPPPTSQRDRNRFKALNITYGLMITVITLVYIRILIAIRRRRVLANRPDEQAGSSKA